MCSRSAEALDLHRKERFPARIGRAPSVQLLREQIAGIMVPDEIHDDVHQLMARLAELTGD